jgi:site-specific DNA-methyltransferase (cytosine-N4-specific)
MVRKSPNKPPAPSRLKLSKLETVDVVYIGDARNMSDIPDESVHLVVTSPPYFNTKDYSKDGFQLSSHSSKNLDQLGDLADFDEFVNELLAVWRECERVLTPNGKLVINVPLVPMTKADLNTHENRHIYDLNSATQQSIINGIPGLFLLDTYIWNRTNPSKKLMFGSYPTPTNFYAQNTIEFVTVYVKRGKSRKVSEVVKEKSKLTQAEWVEFTKQVWDIPIPNKADIAFGKHSALMPEAIAERCIRLYSFVGDVVLDPFAGSGTTLRVAQRLDRRFVGYEVVASYSSIIEEKVGKSVCRKASGPKTQRLQTKAMRGQDVVSRVEVSDAVEFLKSLPTSSVQLLCTDPPYNMKKAEWDTFDSQSHFLAFTKAWISESIRVVSPGGAFFVFNSPENAAHIFLQCESLGLQFRNWITWDKRDGFASTKSKFVPAQETILYFVKPGGEPVFNADSVRIPYESEDRIAAAAKRGILKNGKRWFPNPNGKLCTDVWHVSSERHKSKVNGRIQKPIHPTQKPLEIIDRIIRATTNIGDFVLDPFVGSGTTAVSALSNARGYLCCDNDPNYVAMTQKRLRDVVKVDSVVRDSVR